jgi:transposase-like protein
MERVPHGRYTKEFREEAVRMATDGGLSVLELSKRLSLPQSTLQRWIRVSRTGNLSRIGKNQRTLRRSRYEVRGDQGVATCLLRFNAVPCVRGNDKRILCLGQATAYHPTAGGDETGIGDTCCS